MKQKHSGHANLAPWVQGIGAALGGAGGDATSAAPQTDPSQEDDSTEAQDAKGNYQNNAKGGPIAQSRPSAWQNFINPLGGQGYNQQQLATVQGQNALNLQAAQAQAAQAQAQQGSDLAIKGAHDSAALAIAKQYGIPPEQVPDFLNATYALTKATAQAQNQSDLNKANNLANWSGSPQGINAQNIGFTGGAELPAGQLAKLTQMTSGPGGVTTEYPNLAGAPNTLTGPTSIGSTDTTSSGGQTTKDPVTGKPIYKQVTTNTKGNTFGGGGSSTGIPNDDLSGLYDKFQAAKDNNNSAVTGSESPDDQEDAPFAPPFAPGQQSPSVQQQSQNAPIAQPKPGTVSNGVPQPFTNPDVLGYIMKLLQNPSGANTTTNPGY